MIVCASHEPVPGLPRPRPRRPRRRLLRANEICEQPNSNSGVVMELNDLRVAGDRSNRGYREGDRESCSPVAVPPSW